MKNQFKTKNGLDMTFNNLKNYPEIKNSRITASNMKKSSKAVELSVL